MIRINLLPEELRGRGRRTIGASRPGVSAGTIAAIAALILIDLAAFYAIFHRIQAAKDKTAEMKAELADKTAERDKLMPDYVLLRDLREELIVKEAILKTLDPPDRILWSQKLNMLCYIVHPEVFITNLNLTEDVQMVETEASIKRRQDWEAMATKPAGGPPEPVKVPIITQTLTITGITTGDTNREQLDSFREFWTALQSYKTKDNRGADVGFMDGFAKTEVPESGLVFDQVVGGKDVGQFTITLTTVPMSGETGV